MKKIMLSINDEYPTDFIIKNADNIEQISDNRLVIGDNIIVFEKGFIKILDIIDIKE